MCGLVYHKSLTKQDVVDKVVKRYTAQRKRGTEGFGIFTPADNMIHRATTEDLFLECLENLKEPDRSEIFLHHRMPTSTPNTLKTTHPFSTGNMFEHNYILAHNGIIWNSDALQKSHAEQGIKYKSMQEDGEFNDSESLLWEIAMYLEHKIEFPATRGGAAFIVIEQVHLKDGWKPYKLHFGRNSSNPLYLTLNDDELILASEATVMDDAESIMPGYLHTYNFRMKSLTIKPIQLEAYRQYQHASDASDGSWDRDDDGHYSWKPATKSPLDNAKELDDDYYAKMADDYAKENKAPQKTPTQLTDGNELTANELDKAADNLLEDLMDRCADWDELEYRLGNDIKRSQQAVKQLGEQLTDGKLRPKSIKKYYKYREYLKICIRAAAMFTLIVDPIEIPEGEVVDAT